MTRIVRKGDSGNQRGDKVYNLETRTHSQNRLEVVSVKEEHKKSLLEYIQARSDMAQAESELDQFIAAIDQVRNELQKWREIGHVVEVSALPSNQDVAKSLKAYNAAKAAADQAARTLPEALKKMFQPT